MRIDTPCDKPNRSETIDLDKPPDHCPVCLCGIQPIELNLRFYANDWAESVFRCPRRACSRFFIAQYRVSFNMSGSGLVGRLSNLVPLTIEIQDATEVIASISPDYAAIVKQAQEAEVRKLTLVAGPGYRKALEFLVKDYLIKINPTKADKIKRMPLSNCITDFVSNERVKQMATRAAWLGNDEVHYERLWQETDLEDLKALIRLTVYWIEMDELTEARMHAMPEGKR